MIYLFYIATCLLLIYIFNLLQFIKYFPLTTNKRLIGNIVPISIIVAIKNAEDSTIDLIECFKKQDYNGNIEFILVDDESNDNTANVIKNISKEDKRFKYASSINGDESLSFKKKALDVGINKAKNEWLLFTDVDCRPSKTWVKEMAEYFVDENDYVVGVSTVIPSKTEVSKFQSLDFQLLIGAAVAQCNKGVPWACTGQNQAYRKSLFKKVNGFKHISNLLQGDDSVFMQLCRYADANIVSALTEHSVISRTENNLWSFLKQRMRWAGDSKYMINLCPTFFLVSLNTFLINFFLLIFLLFNFAYFFPLFFLKSFFEYKLYSSLKNSSITTHDNSDNIFIWGFLQIPYIVLMGLTNFWSHKIFGWKK